MTKTGIKQQAGITKTGEIQSVSIARTRTNVSKYDKNQKCSQPV